MIRQTLYSLRSHVTADGTPHDYFITKFVDGEVESAYALSASECTCPAGHRPSCRHRQMLPEMIARGLVNTHWFWDFDRHYACDFSGSDKRTIDALEAEEDEDTILSAPVVKLVDTPDSKSVDPVGSNPTGGTTLMQQQQASRPWRRL